MQAKLRVALSLLVLALPLVIGMPAQAQENTGSIVGKVTSTSGGVAGARVTARNTQTGQTLSTAASANGSYRLTQVPVGTYDVSSDSSGYQTASETASVTLGEGTTVNLVLLAAGEDPAQLGRIQVMGTAIAPIDVTQAERTTVITAADIERLPLQRDVNAIALVAPGAVLGDDVFGGDGSQDRQHYSTRSGLVSFGGASVAENSYFINGFNVSNFRNGLGGGSLPFHFYDQFQLKTGGFGAEFGRSTGGVINAITKRGTNEWKFGVGAYFEPGSLNGESPDVFTSDGGIYQRYTGDEKEGQEIYVSAGGPIIEDRLFVYATYTLRDFTRENFTTSQYRSDKDDDPFWGAKIDWNITDDHSLEVTAFSDKHTTFQDQFRFDPVTNTIGDRVSDFQAQYDRGGDVSIFKYTGHITDNLTVSAMYGTSEYDVSTGGGGADTQCPTIFDTRGASTESLGCWLVQIPEQGTDERDAIRVDAELFVGDRHLLRVGVDIEETTSMQRNGYGALGSGPAVGGGIRYFYGLRGDSPTGEGVQVRELGLNGGFETDTEAFYIEDEWSITDTVTLRLGLRNERFENRNFANQPFIEIDDQWAPRIGLSWDVQGDGRSKLFFNAGRYHLPIASNTNIRLAGNEYFDQQWFALDTSQGNGGLNPDDTPIFLLDAMGQRIPLTSQAVFSDGIPDEPATVLDTTIDPMYQDEYIIGYERELWTGWVGSITGTYRDLASTIEDVTIDAAIQTPFLFHYILTNPGTPVNTRFDLDGDGFAEEYNFTAAEMGFPEGKRKYIAWTLALEKLWDGKFYIQGSYTWSHSYGNIEGYVRSDNGQDDAGLTTLYDFPGLMDGSNGNLPNDRRHSLKVAGTYQFAPGWLVGGFLTIQSGRPKNSFSTHPTDPFSFFYEDESYYFEDRLVPRGTLGNTPTTKNLDMMLQYQTDLGRGEFTARLDVFNIFNFDDWVSVDESADDGNSCPPTIVFCGASGAYTVNPSFGLPNDFQRPRVVRIGVTYDF